MQKRKIQKCGTQKKKKKKEIKSADSERDSFCKSFMHASAKLGTFMLNLLINVPCLIPYTSQDVESS